MKIKFNKIKIKSKQNIVLIISLLIFLLSFVLFIITKTNSIPIKIEKKNTKSVEMPKEKIQIFELENGNLKASIAEIEKTDTKLTKIEKTITKQIEALIDLNLLSEKFKLNNVFVVNETCFVDFNIMSKTLEADTKENREIIQIFTKCIFQFENIKKIKFLVNNLDGKKLLEKFYENNEN